MCPWSLFLEELVITIWKKELKTDTFRLRVIQQMWSRFESGERGLKKFNFFDRNQILFAFFFTYYVNNASFSF
jgi:hypothetical protein